MWPSIPSGNVAPLPIIVGNISFFFFFFFYKTKHKAADKTLE